MWDRIERMASRKRSSSNVVAIAWYRNSLFIGRNSLKTSPQFKRTFPDAALSFSRHAEMDLLARLPRSTNHSVLTVYVMRWRKDGKLTMAKPCEACTERLVRAGIKPERIHYIDWSGDWKRLR